MKMIGIVDALGIESFIPLEGHQREVFIFNLRSKANQQRNAINYCLDFTDGEIEKINNLLKEKTEQSFVEAGIIVTEKLDSINKTNHARTDKLLKRFYKLSEYR
jgi:hypothetical protein